MVKRNIKEKKYSAEKKKIDQFRFFGIIPKAGPDIELEKQKPECRKHDDAKENEEIPVRHVNAVVSFRNRIIHFVCQRIGNKKQCN